MDDKNQHKEREIVYPTVEELIAINRYIVTGEGGDQLPKDLKEHIDKDNAWRKPRDPERIAKILELLKQLWLRVSDQRMGQFLLNYAFSSADHRDKTSVEMYAQEDDETLANLERLLEKVKAEEKAKQPKA